MKQRLKRLTRISKGIQRNLAEFEASLVGPKFAIVLEQKELEKRSKQRRPRRKLRIRKRELCFSKRESDNKLFITNYLVRNMQNNASIVRYSGISSGSLCGYCKSTKVARRETFGVIAHLLSPEVFNQILDVGWSRSLGLPPQRFSLSMPVGQRLEAIWKILVQTDYGENLLPSVHYSARCAQISVVKNSEAHPSNYVRISQMGQETGSSFLR
uniref:Arginyltransferase n=1 Tax=Ditylenchus dipsaci TaxID=166011 RepID=A0A915EPJ9_9BILA